MNSRRAWICVVPFTLTSVNDADCVALSTAARPISAELGLSHAEPGYLPSSFLCTYVVCLIPVGMLVDRSGGKLMNGLGIGLWSAATVLTGLAPSLLFIMGIRFAMGMGEATSWPACNRVIHAWFPASARGIANAIFGAGSAFGPALGSLLIVWVVSTLGRRAGFFAAGATGFLWLAARYLLFDRPERVGWLHPAERDHTLAHRDGHAASRQTDVPVSSLAYLLSLPSVWGRFLTRGSMVLGRLPVADLPAQLPAAGEGAEPDECRHHLGHSVLCRRGGKHPAGLAE